MSDNKLSKAQEKILEALDYAANIYSGDFNFEFGYCTEIDCGEETWDMKVTHEDFDWLFLSFPVCGQDGDIFPQMDFHEDHWEEITQEQFFTYAFFESATQIAQLKQQLADETAERKRLEDNEDAMVAYHDELERKMRYGIAAAKAAIQDSDRLNKELALKPLRRFVEENDNEQH